MRQEPACIPSLLDELDSRQNEVLHQLDALNHRIETVLREFAGQMAEVFPPKVEG